MDPRFWIVGSLISMGWFFATGGAQLVTSPGVRTAVFELEGAPLSDPTEEAYRQVHIFRFVQRATAECAKAYFADTRQDRRDWSEMSETYLRRNKPRAERLMAAKAGAIDTSQTAMLTGKATRDAERMIRFTSATITTPFSAPMSYQDCHRFRTKVVTRKYDVQVPKSSI